MTKTVYQFDAAGLYTGETEADESPLEPGVFLIPARCVEAPPPEEIPDGQWPRWNGAAWVLIQIPQHQVEESPVAKLKAFLAANPDVAELLG